jgi:hypothetical protein
VFIKYVVVTNCGLLSLLFIFFLQEGVTHINNGKNNEIVVKVLLYDK